MSVKERHIRHLTHLVADIFQVASVYRQQDRLTLGLVSPDGDPRRVAVLRDRLQTAGYRYELDDAGTLVTLTVATRRVITIPRLNVVLFLATLFSVYVVPVFFSRYQAAAYAWMEAQRGGQADMARGILSDALQRTWEALQAGAGLEFTLALMSILLVHEMGHWVVSRHHGIVTSWPYFIPAPSLIGTFGAVIRTKSPFWSRNELVQVGAAGPIAGWVVAVAWLVYGLGQSALVPVEHIAPGQLAFFLEGESVLVRVLAPMLISNPQPGYAYVFTEAAFAGWVGLFVTALNLLPIGQLDGGHILFGWVGRYQHRVARLAIPGLVVLGFWWQGWWVYAILGLMFGVTHPPTMDDSRPLGTTARTMALASLVILVLSFTPVPFRL